MNLPAAQLSLQLAATLGAAMQLTTAISILSVILKTVQVREAFFATHS
jgi:hypothetical protein